jgi:hypothetical protein
MDAGCVDSVCGDGFAAGSVAGHVDPESAPIIAIHGDRDPGGTVAGGQTGAAAYTAAGIGPRFAIVVISSGDDEARGHAPDLNRVGDAITARGLDNRGQCRSGANGRFPHLHDGAKLLCPRLPAQRHGVLRGVRTLPASLAESPRARHPVLKLHQGGLPPA